MLSDSDHERLTDAHTKLGQPLVELDIRIDDEDEVGASERPTERCPSLSPGARDATWTVGLDVHATSRRCLLFGSGSEERR
jgi:hypothetical protein